MKKKRKSILTMISCLTILLIVIFNKSLIAFAGNEEGDSLQVVAVVEIENYEVSDKNLEAGKGYTLDVKLHNTARNTPVRSLTMTITSSLGAIYPTYGTGNQLFIGTLEADESRVVSMPITVASDFKGKAADLVLKLEYINSGKQLSNSISIVLPIASENILDVKTLDVSAHATVNGKSLLSLTVLNNSSNDIDDATLILDGNLSEDSKVIKLDVVSAGKSYSKDCQICFTQAGDQELDVSLIFTDLNGNHIEKYVGNYVVTVSDEYSSGSLDASGDPQLKMIGRVIALVAISVVVLVVWRYFMKR